MGIKVIITILIIETFLNEYIKFKHIYQYLRKIKYINNITNLFRSKVVKR